MIELKGKYTTAKVMIDFVEQSCISQIYEFLNHPAFTNQIAIMPDCHSGKGSVIGFTMPITDKIVPNVIGVDISCGIISVNVGKSLSLSLENLDHKIRQQIPFGFDTNEKSVINMEREFPWKQANISAQKFAVAYQEKFNQKMIVPNYSLQWFEEKCKIIGCDFGRAIKSLRSLGGGNHFIEIGKSTKNEYWLTVHTGSRNFGKCICEYWQNIAIKKLKNVNKDERKNQVTDLKNKLQGKELFEAIKSLKSGEKESHINFSDELCYLEGNDAQQYLFDMIFAQTYAQVNRQLISQKIQSILNTEIIDSIETIHNFIDFQDFIIRKGSIRSYKNERMVIPFNMRDGILICEGKSNPEWNFSGPHGAGRIMSRAQAKKSIDIETFKSQMSSIFSTSVNNSTLDEAPDAYKNPKIIEESIEPTATIIDRIIPIHNMKDSSGTSD